MGTFIDRQDLEHFAEIDPGKAEAMISDAESVAILTAPCIVNLPLPPVGETADEQTLRLAKLAAVKGVLRAAILRWQDAGSGAVQVQQVGPFGQTMDTRQARRSLFWQSELDILESLCKPSTNDQAFTIDTAPDAYATTTTLPLWQPDTLWPEPWY